VNRPVTVTDILGMQGRKVMSQLSPLLVFGAGLAAFAVVSLAMGLKAHAVSPCFTSSKRMLRRIQVFSLSALSLLAMSQLAAPAYAASTTSFSFGLTPPNVTRNPMTGFFLRTTGSGAFVMNGSGTIETETSCSNPTDPSNPGPNCKTVFWGTGDGLSISGGGSWGLIAPDGATVVDRGTWAAAKFGSFTYWGRLHTGGGLLGGDLELLATLTSSETGVPIPGGSDVAAAVICRHGDPPLPEGETQTLIPGVTQPEGIFIVPLGFTQRTAGTTIFHSDSVLPF